MYFSTVPSQKSTLSSLATITEQLLWLGGPAPACLTPLLPASLRNRLDCPKFTPGSQKQAEGRHKSVCDSVCLHPVKTAQITEFLSMLVAAAVEVVEGGWISKFTCGRMPRSQFIFKITRHTETCMTLARSDLPGELIMTYCNMHFLVLLRHINAGLLFKVKINLFLCKVLSDKCNSSLTVRRSHKKCSILYLKLHRS